LKGSRECTYPPSPQKDNSYAGKILVGVKETLENRQHSNGSESMLNFDVLNVVDRSQKVVMKVLAQGSSATTSSVNLFRSNQQMLIDPLRTPANGTKYFYNPPSSLIPLSVSGIRPRHFLVQSSANARAIQIPTIPKSIRDRFIQFFLNFHQENINEFHYFCYYDYQKFCTRTLMVMVDQSNALRDAVVAFSALIYSIKIDRSARVQAFLYYTSALKQLRALLDQVTLNVDECHMAIATALQLASFDVFTISIKELILSVSSMIRSNVSDICMAPLA